MEIAAVAGRRHKARADGEVTEAFALLATCGIGGENRSERGEDAGVIEILGIELVETGAVNAAPR